MLNKARVTGGTTVGLCLVGLVLAGCAGPSSAPSAPPTSPPIKPASAAPPSPSNANAPSPSPSPASAASPAARPSPSASPAAAIATEPPVAAEISPAGDIPDNQVFVGFTSPTGGYQLQVPEAWARTDSGPDVRFVSKLDGVQVTLSTASTAPTAASAQAAQVADLQRSGRAVQISTIQDTRLPAGAAVQVDFTSNSDPDPVTGKQVRLENNAYLFYKDGKLATLTLWAPQGADNVDQWQQMAQSFRWQ